MRVVFMGTPSFAVPSLEALAEGHVLTAVYTRPDAASGRGKTLLPSPVKVQAEQLGLPVRQPRTLRDGEVISSLAGEAPDVIVVAAFGMILPREVLDIPKFGCINVHASLLPRWRGAAPIQRAILAGDDVTGVSIMQMEEGLDTGAYCERAQVDVDGKTTAELTDELAVLGARTLIAALGKIEQGTAVWTRQEESLVTYADKIEKCEVALSPSDTIESAILKVRASSDQAPARMVVEGRGATVLALRAADAPVPSGSVACTKKELILGFANGAGVAESVKPDGKPAMRGCDWARGARFDAECTWAAQR